MALGILPPPIVLRAMLALEYLTVILPFAVCMVDFVDSGGKQLPPMYWNSSNPIFASSNSEININLSDSIDVFCPYYSISSQSENWEYYVIYFVSKQEYDACTIYDTRNVTMVLNCSKPTNTPPLMFTMWVDSFQPFLKMPDFKPGKYYLITTSTGTRVGLDNQYHGACKTRNMRLVMNVCCGSDDRTTRSTTHNSHSTQGPNTPHITPAPTTQRPITAAPTTRPTTTKRTTRRPTTTTRSIPSTTKFPTKPIDPSKNNIIIDATGTSKNSGLINSSRTLKQSPIVSFMCILLATLFILLLR